MEHILAFVIFFADAKPQIDVRSEYRFASYEACERFANTESREIIINDYKGIGAKSVMPACKHVDRFTAMKINAEKGI